MSALELISNHILLQAQASSKPLFVGLQGPQGSGKSFLSAKLESRLSSAPHSLRVVVLSIDDIYLTHDGLVSLAVSHPKNMLWQGRGQPGTHDVDLGVRTLSALKSGAGRVEIPSFDKGLYDGEGDRLPADGFGKVISQPPIIDIVILEGWCVGFNSISQVELVQKWDGIWKDEREKLGLADEQVGREVDVCAVNEKLKDYVRLWEFLDVFVQLKPSVPTVHSISQYSVIYKWRLQQEHNMKANNGGRGMSDEAVKAFVDRYIPGYVFFGDLARARNGNSLPWAGKGLIVFINETREVVSSETC